MYVASQNGHTDTVDLLLKEGADVNLANTSLVKVFKVIEQMCFYFLIIYKSLEVFLWELQLKWGTSR